MGLTAWLSAEVNGECINAACVEDARDGAILGLVRSPVFMISVLVASYVVMVCHTGLFGLFMPAWGSFVFIGPYFASCVGALILVHLFLKAQVACLIDCGLLISLPVAGLIQASVTSSDLQLKLNELASTELFSWVPLWGCVGFFLGSRPSADLSLRRKLRTAALFQVLHIASMYTKFIRTEDWAAVTNTLLYVDLPFYTLFGAGLGSVLLPRRTAFLRQSLPEQVLHPCASTAASHTTQATRRLSGGMALATEGGSKAGTAHVASRLSMHPGTPTVEKASARTAVADLGEGRRCRQRLNPEKEVWSTTGGLAHVPCAIRCVSCRRLLQLPTSTNLNDLRYLQIRCAVCYQVMSLQRRQSK